MFYRHQTITTPVFKELITENTIIQDALFRESVNKQPELKGTVVSVPHHIHQDFSDQLTPTKRTNEMHSTPLESKIYYFNYNIITIVEQDLRDSSLKLKCIFDIGIPKICEFPLLENLTGMMN